MQAGKVVILLSGRYAGKKAVIVKNYDDGASGRPYGHALVCGLSKEPRKVGCIAIHLALARASLQDVSIVHTAPLCVYLRNNQSSPLMPPACGCPVQVTRKSSQKVQARRSSVKCFIKTVNYQHMMPTRYTLEVELKNVITAESVENPTAKVEAAKEAKKLLEEKFKSGKNRWFFTKLRF